MKALSLGNYAKSLAKKTFSIANDPARDDSRHSFGTIGHDTRRHEDTAAQPNILPPRPTRHSIPNRHQPRHSSAPEPGAGSRLEAPGAALARRGNSTAPRAWASIR